ncbi:hypothetical protein ALP27_05260, partial [Pseudomonas savastanoi pv. glycinea]
MGPVSYAKLSNFLKQEADMSFDAFMQVDGVEGESLDNAHKGWVELLSYHYDAVQSISTTASSSGGATA